MRIAIVQTNPVFGEVVSNVNIALDMIESADADLFVLPELFNTGYNFFDTQEVKHLAEKINGATYQAVAATAAKKSCYIVYGYAEQDDRLYNAAALIGPQGIIGNYRKVHLYYRETLFFAPGNLGFPVFELPFGTIGIMICFDWMYPESARSLALAGAQLIAHPSNLVMPYCPDAMVTRCLENKVFSATANRVGNEDRRGLNLTYIGTSEIVSPDGRILQRMGKEETGVGVAEIDLSAAKNKNINKYNDLIAGRKPGQYHVDL